LTSIFDNKTVLLERTLPNYNKTERRNSSKMNQDVITETWLRYLFGMFDLRIVFLNIHVEIYLGLKKKRTVINTPDCRVP
jgi:hypothetical protein